MSYLEPMKILMLSIKQFRSKIGNIGEVFGFTSLFFQTNAPLSLLKGMGSILYLDLQHIFVSRLHCGILNESFMRVKRLSGCPINFEPLSSPCIFGL